MIPERWCSPAARPGAQTKSGSSERATFMRKVADSER